MKTLDSFTRAYIEAICFTECHSDNPELDGKDWDDFADETKAKIIADCAKFQSENDLADYPIRQAGHDFWFTRNHHGVGFWENDYSTEDVCSRLDRASKAFGEQWVYLGDDGLVYIS